MARDTRFPAGMTSYLDTCGIKIRAPTWEFGFLFREAGASLLRLPIWRLGASGNLFQSSVVFVCASCPVVLYSVQSKQLGRIIGIEL